MSPKYAVPATAAGESTNQKLLGFKELAAALGFGRATLWRLRKRGYIPAAFELGKLTRFDLAEVRRALADRAAEIRQSADDERTGFTPAKRGRPRKNPAQASTPNA